MSVREDIRRALSPDSEVDKAVEFLERIVRAEVKGSSDACTAYNLRVNERADLQMMDRLREAGLVARQSLNHQVAYTITARGREVYEQARSMNTTQDNGKQDDAIEPSRG